MYNIFHMSWRLCPTTRTALLLNWPKHFTRETPIPYTSPPPHPPPPVSLSLSLSFYSFSNIRLSCPQTQNIVICEQWCWNANIQYSIFPSLLHLSISSSFFYYIYLVTKTNLVTPKENKACPSIISMLCPYSIVYPFTMEMGRKKIQNPYAKTKPAHAPTNPQPQNPSLNLLIIFVFFCAWEEQWFGAFIVLWSFVSMPVKLIHGEGRRGRGWSDSMDYCSTHITRSSDETESPRQVVLCPIQS